MINFLKRLNKALVSPYLTMVLLMIILLSMALGTLIYSKYGQEGALEQANQMVFHSWWFLLTALVLLLNALLCTIRQFNLAVKRYKKFVPLPPIEGQVAQVLKRYGFNSRGQKYPFGVFMSPLFHLGITVIILGAFLDYFTGFSGNLTLRPGLEREDSPQQYQNLEKKLFYQETHQRFSIRLDEIYLDYDDVGAVSSGLITLFQDGKHVLHRVLDGNNPIWLGTVGISKDKYGYYVNYQIKDQAGSTIDDRRLGLQTYPLDKGTKYWRESFTPENQPYTLEMELFPTVGKQGGHFVAINYQLNDPAIFTTVYRGDSKVFSGLVKQGKTVRLSDGNNFTFSSVTPYFVVRVQSIVGIYILAGGFMIFLLGLLVYFTLYPAILRVEKREGQYKVAVTAWTGRFALQEEAKIIEEQLNQLRER